MGKRRSPCEGLNTATRNLCLDGISVTNEYFSFLPTRSQNPFSSTGYHNSAASVSLITHRAIRRFSESILFSESVRLTASKAAACPSFSVAQVTFTGCPKRKATARSTITLWSGSAIRATFSKRSKVPSCPFTALSGRSAVSNILWPEG